jgi:hypothetical protein
VTYSAADSLVVRCTRPIEIDRVIEAARHRGVEARELPLDGGSVLWANLVVQVFSHRNQAGHDLDRQAPVLADLP